MLKSAHKNPAAATALAFVALIGGMMLMLRAEGRIWWCACGDVSLWNGAMWSAHTSQHVFDHYSFTHVLHGFIFCGLLWWLCPRMRYGWQLWVAAFAEALWELLENSPFIIQRYREVTIDMGYMGDSILNSVGDLASCVIGFVIARRIGLRKSIALFVLVEIALLYVIRDNLTLNIIMLLHPIDAIKQWQMGG